jgi:hypothetical protein
MRKKAEITLHTTETVLGFLGFDRSIYRNFKKKHREENREKKEQDIEAEIVEK